MKGQKINKKGNFVMAVFCLLIGLALIAGGIYMLVTDNDAVTGGAMVGLGALIVALFGCTMYLILNFEKLQKKAEEKAEKEAEERRMERRLEADRLRAERRTEGRAYGAETFGKPDGASGTDLPQIAENEDENDKNAD